MALSLPDIPRPPWSEALAPVVSQTTICGQEHEIVFLAPAIAGVALPGQFLELQSDEYAPLVRRPFSIYRVDRDSGTCSVLFLARGNFTTALAQRRPGDIVSVLGPLGRPFTWRTESGTRHILIAGGIGAPPLMFLANEMCREALVSGRNAPDVHVLNGARTADLLVGTADFGRLNLDVEASTDDGSFGRHGLVTDMLPTVLDTSPETPTCLYACGPMGMLRAVSAIAISRGLPCQVSVETAMPCGIGTCQECTIAIRGECGRTAFALACLEGPVFEGRDLIW